MKISDFRFLNNIIFEVLLKLSNNAAHRPDGFQTILLKKSRHSLANALATILHIIFSDAFLIFSEMIQRGRSRASSANFSLVSLNSNLIKTLERILRVSLAWNLEVNIKLNPKQHG